MTAVVASGGAILPRGWTDFGLQLVIWFGFLRLPGRARAGRPRQDAGDRARLTGDRVETRIGDLFELTFQRPLPRPTGSRSPSPGRTGCRSSRSSASRCSGSTSAATSNSRLPQLGAAREVIGFIGYVVYPTAPPRMFPATASSTCSTHRVAEPRRGCSLANQYAAMPSLHAADSLIVGITLFTSSALVAEGAVAALAGLGLLLGHGDGNHFWLDCLAGVVVALLAGDHPPPPGRRFFLRRSAAATRPRSRRRPETAASVARVTGAPTPPRSSRLHGGARASRRAR